MQASDILIEPVNCSMHLTICRYLHGNSALTPGAVLGLWELLVTRVCPFQATADIPSLLAVIPGHIIKVPCHIPLSPSLAKILICCCI